MKSCSTKSFYLRAFSKLVKSPHVETSGKRHSRLSHWILSHKIYGKSQSSAWGRTDIFVLTSSLCIITPDKFLLSTYFVAGTVVSAFVGLPNLIFIARLRRGFHYYSYFTDEQTDAQKGQLICLRLNS